MRGQRCWQSLGDSGGALFMVAEPDMDGDQKLDDVDEMVARERFINNLERLATLGKMFDGRGWEGYITLGIYSSIFLLPLMV